MDETPISVTIAARKFSDCINSVRYQGASFLLEKNGVPVARLIPVRQNFGSDFEQLATTLRQTRRTARSGPKAEDPTLNSVIQEAEVKHENRPVKGPKRRTLNW
jgi:antitoxin (DNA-binding transcriptional repressor) of toxin-antitoxin stability system